MDALSDLVRVSMHPINFPLTLLLILVICYWLMVILGALDIELFNADADMDADIDMDVGGDADMDAGGDADADVDADAADGSAEGATQGAFWSLLAWLNVGAVPVTVVVSFLVLTMWTASVLSFYYISKEDVLFQLALVVPIMLAGVLATKLISTPLRPLFWSLTRDIDAGTRAVGSVCIVTTSEVTEKFGQGEVATPGATLCLNIRNRSSEPLKKGDKAIVYDWDEDKNVYFVSPLSGDGGTGTAARTQSSRS